jgi:hypothetical protein
MYPALSWMMKPNPKALKMRRITTTASEAITM